MTYGTVTKIEPLGEGRGFRVTSSHDYYQEDHEDKGMEADYGRQVYRRAKNGGAEKTVTARKVILGTGLRDLMGSTPGLQENFGKGNYWCPWCDGPEHQDQKLGIIASMDQVLDMVNEILTLNMDLVAFVNGTDMPESLNAL